ncbi:ubiquitin-related domain-containing protein [Dunaliella salina]|uniref:Ubiquitin-related domain-containing protein n=1 Tax=Dunaliella salina TaxID=3046 RepID=A0ABQ7H1N6_DUNSA|nr:ubiquitin-related domain-containing protein [Dunaliella salina]|eukprot:KAF5840766.1 ubiquitin-related domain-containing protein [Dunaliella salina]
MLLVRSSLMLAHALAFGCATISFLGDRLLPRAVMRGFRGIMRAVLGQSQEPDPAAQANMFIQLFREKYGERHPPFVPLGVKQASLQARAEYRFLFVYLHSSEHQDTDFFCRNVLCSPELLDLLSQQFVCWGGDVRRSDAYTLSTSLGATTFPFTALLSLGPDNKVSLVSAAQGCAVLQPGLLHAVLTTAIADHGALLVAQRADVQEREVNRRLVDEQNAEYEASLEADRVRDLQRQQERQRQEEEQRARGEAEERARSQQEAAEQRRREQAAAIVRRREEKRAILPPVPPPGSASPGCPPPLLVRVRLPDGSNAQRSFPPGSTLGTVYDFVDSLDSTNYWKYNLVSSYPRRVYGHDSFGLALDALGLGTQVALFVQPEDAEEAS